MDNIKTKEPDTNGDVSRLRRKIIDLENLLKKSETARKQIQKDFDRNIGEMLELQKILDEIKRSPLASEFSPRRQDIEEDRISASSFHFLPTNEQLAVENRILHDIVTKIKEDLELAAEETSQVE
jgi:hypothetical protein